MRGFATLYLIIIVIVLGLGGIGAYQYSQKQTNIADPYSPRPEATVSASATASSTTKSGVKTTAKSTVTPSTSPTATPKNSSNDNPCPYGQTTGAVKVEIKPKSGLVVGDQIVELQARSGCKVLDGNYSDKQTLIAKSSSGTGYSSLNSVTFGSVRSGPYNVRVQYKGQWTGNSGVDAVASESRTIEILVDGEAAPTPKPKPSCSLTITPSNSGSAPYSVNVCVGNTSNPSQSVQTEYVNYYGDVSGHGWDYQGAQYGCHAYTYQYPGTYTPKAQITGSNGETSDLCQATITVN